MYKSVCFEPVSIEEEQSTSGGAAVAAAATASSSILNDILRFTGEVDGQPVTLTGSAARAAVLAGLAGTVLLIGGVALPASLSNP